jgi:hypothetical protein
MPHTTFAYPFETKVGGFADGLSQRFTAGSSLRSFLLTFDPDGSTVTLSFVKPASGWFEATKALEASGVPHLFYDPLEDGGEYIWLSWSGVERSVIERLIGERFEEADFLPLADFARRAGRLARAGEFPTTWGVMF